MCTQVPKLKPGSGPKSGRGSDHTLGVEDEDALLLDPDMMAPHSLGAPAARLTEQAQQASQKSQISQQEFQADSAVAAELAPELANLGRRLSPGSAPGPAGRHANLGCSNTHVVFQQSTSCAKVQPRCSVPGSICIHSMRKSALPICICMEPESVGRIMP